jgi:glycosyltransferase involved in cell wall biosynthesis
VARLRGLIASRRVDVVHANGSRAMLYAGLAARSCGLPVLWHVRVVDRDPWLDAALLRLATAVVVNSRAVAARFDGRAGAAARIRVVPNGIDLARFVPGPADPALRRALGLPGEGPVIGYFGRLEPGKGPDVFVEAARDVHAAVAPASFVIVGDGPMRADLERAARQADVPVAFVDRRPDVVPFLRLCAAVVVPSRQEAFGRVLVEAMAMEIPVVATRVGGIPDVCAGGETGLLVPPGDAGALARAVVATLVDADTTRRRVRAAAVDVRARFGSATHAERLLALYDELAGSRRHRGNR